MKRRSFPISLVAGATVGGVLGRSVFSSSIEAYTGMQTLRSVEHLTTDTAVEIFDRHKVEGTRRLIRYDVDVYRATYATRDSDGTEVVASGAILVPKVEGPTRTLAYCRGTILPVEYEYTAPSYYDLKNNQSIYENYEMSYLAATFASAGYLVVAPDGIGYGATKDREHPYMHADSLGSTWLDMVRAAREFATERKLAFDPRIHIAGWSEGGLCGMALHKLIEETCRGELTVAGSSHLAGTLAMERMLELFCSFDEDYPETHIYYWMLRAMARIYGLDRPFARTVDPSIAPGLEKNVLGQTIENPTRGLVPEFRKAFLEDDRHEMRVALRRNDRYDWKPIAPVYLHHGTRDDIVPFFCSMMAYESIRARGARARLYPYLGKDHYQPVNDFVIRTIADFAETV